MTAVPVIVMLGDSLTAGHAWDRAFPGLTVVNLGQNGDTCAGVWCRLDDAVETHPDRIFLQIGINDFLQGAAPEEIVAGHLRIWKELAEKAPRARLVVQSLTPYMEEALPGLPPNLDIMDANLLLAEKAAERGLTLIDLFTPLADEDYQLRLEYTSDGLHLTPEAYRIWEERLRPFLPHPAAD